MKVLDCLDLVLGSLDLVPWLPGEGSWLPRFHFPVAWTLFHGCMEKVPGCPDSVPGCTGIGSIVVCRRFLVSWIHFRVAWNLFHGCLVKVSGCLDSVTGCLDLVKWLPGDGSWLPRLTSWLLDLVPRLSGFNSWCPGESSC